MENIKEGYTRISTILSVLPSVMGMDESGRELWGFPLQTINPEVLRNKCIIGTNVHSAINAWAHQDFAPLTANERGYFQSFCQWQELTQMHPIQSELRLYDEKIKITGAIDMLGKIKDSDNLILIDFKTSATCDNKKWPLQAAFYHHLLMVNEFEVHPNVLFLQLDKEGKMPVCHAFEITNQLKVTMLSAYNLYKYLTSK